MNKANVVIVLLVVLTCLLGGCAPSTVTPAWSSLLVSQDILYTGSQGGRVYALNAVSNGEIWRCPPAAERAGKGAFYAAPVRLEDILYIGSNDGQLYALDANTGSQRWIFSSGEPIVADAVVVDGMLYVASSDHKLYALDAESGLKKWEFATGNWIWGRPAVAAGKVYVA